MKFEEDNAIFDTPFGIIALFKDSDAKPVYQGRGVARGIKCDVWRQIRINWPGDAQAYTIWRWFFTEKEGEESLLVRILIIESCYFFYPERHNAFLPSGRGMDKHTTPTFFRQRRVTR